VIGYWLLVIGYWLLVIGYWLLVIGYWLLVIGWGKGLLRSREAKLETWNLNPGVGVRVRVGGRGGLAVNRKTDGIDLPFLRYLL
jgi:hypothetical protein